MAQTNVLVKHALLAVTATYYLDLKPSKALEDFAQRHHTVAVRHLGAALNAAINYKPGNENIILAGIILLNQDDVSPDSFVQNASFLSTDRLQVINWEARDIIKVPKWYAALQAAKSVLRISDPAVMYRDPENIQCSKARLHLGSMLAEEDIFASVVAPLDLTLAGQKLAFGWLIQGNLKDQTRIRGLIGMCPKLLHIFAKITQVCIELNEVSRHSEANFTGRG